MPRVLAGGTGGRQEQRDEVFAEEPPGAMAEQQREQTNFIIWMEPEKSSPARMSTAVGPPARLVANAHDRRKTAIAFGRGCYNEGSKLHFQNPIPCPHYLTHQKFSSAVDCREGCATYKNSYLHPARQTEQA